MIDIPKEFKISRLAPSRAELQWLHRLIEESDKTYENILEFGCGVTTWVMYHAAKPTKYIAVENFKDSIRQVCKYIPKVEIIQTWPEIPKVYYDLIFVDSSAGSGKKGIHRLEVVKMSQRYMNENSIIIIHDWRREVSWYKKVRTYLDNNLEFIDCLKSRNGLGAYRLPQ